MSDERYRANLDRPEAALAYAADALREGVPRAEVEAQLLDRGVAREAVADILERAWSAAPADYNAVAFRVALRATGLPTFREARAALTEIDDRLVTDAEVERYVAFCRELADYCIVHGIQRHADISLWSVLRTADYGTASRTALGRWWHEGVWGPLKSVVEGGAFALRLPGWFALQQQLLARYG
jgi:hypothetical protein